MMRTVKIIVCFILIFVVNIIISGCQFNENDTKQGKISDMKQFSAFTQNNELYTSDCFANYDLTLIIFWAPWSEVSIYEMGKLGEYMESVPDRIQLVTVCFDGTDTTVKEALKKTGLNRIPTLVSGNGDFKTVADEIKNVPTVIFFDNEGKAIGNPIVGAKENLKEYYTEEINKRLKSLHKSQIDLIEESAIETTGYKDNVNKKIVNEKYSDENSSHNKMQENSD